MKIKIIISVFLFFICSYANAYTLIINKTFLSHDPNGQQPDYNYVDRNEKVENEPLDPNKIKSKTVNIFCEGNGALSCPSSIVAPSDQADGSNFMTLAALNAAQTIFNTAVLNYEVSGIKNNSSGTISTPDGLLYSYTINWTTNLSTGKVDLVYIVNSL